MSNYYTEELHGPHETFELGNYALENGQTFPDAKLTYKTHGTLNAAKDNVILFPHMWSGTPMAMEAFIGEGRPLDPSKYFIILPGQLANGFSSSPNNTPSPLNGGSFPQLSYGDDVRAQHQLLTEKFGIRELQLVLGWSMGAGQTYEWAVRYRDMVKRAMPIAGTAKTTDHNSLFVRSIEMALKSDPAWDGGYYAKSEDVHVGIRRMAQLWSVMGLCQAFYSAEVWRDVGFSSLDDFMVRFWEAYFLQMDPNCLLWQAMKWRNGDVSKHAGGDLRAALSLIKAKTLVVSFSDDMFFPPHDCLTEQKMIANSSYREVKSLWAHFTMFCMNDTDREQIDTCISDLLNDKL